MIITNSEVVPIGTYNKLRTALLLGKTNTGCDEISIQITHIEPEGEQSLHKHSEHQCYYIITGVGLMAIEGESNKVKAGDAIYIPGNMSHGIKNIGNDQLTYLTANKSFDEKIEKSTWNNCKNVKSE